jgi:Ca-activated chloride channel family protein
MLEMALILADHDPEYEEYAFSFLQHFIWISYAMDRIGEHQDNPQQKTEAWEQAVKEYQSALKLNPQDSDAQFNLALVTKKLEELRQQQEQSKQPNKDKSKDDKDQQKQDKNQDQQPSKDDQKEQQQQPPKPEDKQQQNQDKQPNKADQKKPEDQSQSAQNEDKPDDKDKPDEKNSTGAQNQPGKEPNESAQAPATAGQMTKEQVQKLLDAVKGEEKAMIFQPPQKARSKTRVFKDW